MKSIEIRVNRSEIDEELSKLTAYTGTKSTPGGGGEEFDRVATVDSDSELLSRYWHTAGGILTEQLKEFVTAADISDRKMELTLEVSGAYDESLTPSVKEGVFSFVAATMAMKWFLLTYPAKGAEWEAEATRLMRETLRKLYHRRKPMRGKAGIKDK